MTNSMMITVSKQHNLTVEAVDPADLPALVSMLDELAAYEKVDEAMCSTTESLHVQMFGLDPRLFGFIARLGMEPVGTIIGYETYSTFAARPRLFIEDLFVRSHCRGGGIGRALIAAVAHRCLARGYSGLQWRVLDWNAAGIGFYRSIGAAISTEHRTCSLTGTALDAIAEQQAHVPPSACSQ